MDAKKKEDLSARQSFFKNYISLKLKFGPRSYIYRYEINCFTVYFLNK